MLSNDVGVRLPILLFIPQEYLMLFPHLDNGEIAIAQPLTAQAIADAESETAYLASEVLRRYPLLEGTSSLNLPNVYPAGGDVKFSIYFADLHWMLASWIFAPKGESLPDSAVLNSEGLAWTALKYNPIALEAVVLYDHPITPSACMCFISYYPMRTP